MSDKIATQLQGLNIVLVRVEKVLRASHETARNHAHAADRIVANTAGIPKMIELLEQLLDVLVGKRTNGHADLQASTTDAERTEP